MSEETAPPRGRLAALAPFARKTVLLILLAAAWELYARWLGKPLVLPTFTATMAAFFRDLLHGELPARIATSVRILLAGYGIGVLLAALLTSFAAGTRLGADLLELLTSMLNPLPAIALLPLALIWFGLGAPSIVFVTVHAVLWPVALNGYAGFKGVSPTLRCVGQNYGLSHPRFVVQVLVPAAFPSILTGLKTGWAFAWRTLIAAELVFGVSSGSGGLGWYIYENKVTLEIPAVFAGLVTVILIGLLVEIAMFGVIERLTVRRWGMTSR
jgi:NitT/TauT family transport system permease protein